MKGLTGEFVKLLQIAVAVGGVLAIFFIFIQYEISYTYHEKEREVFTLGDSLLGSKCLTELDLNENPIKALFLEEKLDSIENCINYPNGKFRVYLLDKSREWEIELGSYGKQEATFDVAVKLGSGEIKPGKLNVVV